ncbi:MAG: DUF2029 domain-containing protein [Candidatus Lokiarchaeota archaeon]|nr:DUF2029 domain-containing protein [Candidatus Lokiarchaeota archaeon]MBD3343190.1 DUF2029 domain-containing protein [Candidatus Lokiarchaeota archaeon]
MNLLKRFKELWHENKILRFAIVVHLGYFVVSLVLVLTILREQNDFLIFYTAGGVFFNNINDLYNQKYYIWDFRYFPLSAMLFVPFYWLGFDLGFILFHCLNLIANIFVCWLLSKIIFLIRAQDHEKDNKRMILYISFYLMAIPHMFNYILGQVNVFVSLLILLALYVFLNHNEIQWQLIGSLALGFSIIIKPTAFFIIPFLLIINFQFKEHKKFNFDLTRNIIRILGVFVPLSLNLVLFTLYPKLWEGFIATNFTGSNPLTLNFSFSITKLITNFCYIYNIAYNQLVILITMIIIVGGLAFVIYLVGKFDKNCSIIYGITLGMIVMLLAYFDSWDHHLLNIVPLLIIIIFNLPRNSEITDKFIKKGLFFFCFFDLAFMGIWFLTVPYHFPYNFGSTVFLILIFYGITKVSLSLNDQEKIIYKN